MENRELRVQTPADASGEAQEVRHCVMFAFDVLARKTVGAVDDEPCQLSRYHLDRLAVGGTRSKLAGSVEPAYRGSVVPNG
jgi:hypothetical protein